MTVPEIPEVPVTEIRESPSRQRFEAVVGGRVVGTAEYQLGSDEIVFTHTFVDPAFRGGRIAVDLAAVALDAARARGLRVVPACSFFRRFIRADSQYQDLVTPPTGRG